LPNFLYEKLLEGEIFTFSSLPEENQIPPDERTHTFLNRLEQAKLTDEKYMEAIDAVKEDEENAQDKIKQIERYLRNRIREELNLPVWKEQKNMTNAEIAVKYGLNPNYEVPEPTAENQEKNMQRNGRFIQTLLASEEMSRKLSGLNSYIHSDIEGTGVNTLYIAFGFLEWYESKSSDKPCISPLLLLQLEIEKKQSRDGYMYRIRSTGEEFEMNLSLSERLYSDFGIKFPELTEEDMPEHYMAQLIDLIKEAKIPQKEKWRVKRFITIGRFSFARLVMFHDLDEKKWPDGASVSANKIIQHLFAGSEEESTDTDYAEDYDIDTPEVEKAVPLLIASADASQHSAIVDIMNGKNLAIIGPPGTGKSQTITNIIACALAEGKTVLFLAEKMAALNVVYERLSKASLSSYCMAIHSTKAQKIEILKSIKERLDQPFFKINDFDIASKLQEFKRHKNYISAYIDILNSPFGRQNRTIHEYLWAAQLRKDRIGDLFNMLRQITIPFELADLTKDELIMHLNDLQYIVSLKKKIDKDTYQGHHPWDFVGNTLLNPFQQDVLIQLVSDLKEQFEEMKKIFDDFSARFGLSIRPCIHGFDLFCDKTEKLVCESVDSLNLQAIAKLGSRDHSEALIAFVKNIKIYKSTLEKISVIKNVPTAIALIEEIEQKVAIAQELEISEITLQDIRLQTKDEKEKLELLKRLLNIGKCFGLSLSDNMSKIRLLIETADCITSVPREFLLFRSENTLKEINTSCLENAVDIQKDIREQETNYDLSFVWPSQEICLYASTLCNAGIFSCLSSSYYRARKFFLMLSKHKTKFRANDAGKTLWEIARMKEKWQKLEQNSQLQTICGSFFNGLDTDFEKILKINKWAAGVRKCYIFKDEFSKNIYRWILTADMEELDLLLDISESKAFVQLKSKIVGVNSTIQLDMSIEKYLNELENRCNKLSDTEKLLSGIGISENATFAKIITDLLPLKEAAEARIAIENNAIAKEFFDNYYAGIDTDIHDIEQTVKFIEQCFAIPEITDSFGMFLNENFSITWQNFIESRRSVQTSQKALKDLLLKSQEQLSISSSRRLGDKCLEYAPYGDLSSMFAKAIEKEESLDAYIEFNTRFTEAARDLKGILLAIYDREKIDFDTLPLAFEYVIYRSIASKIYSRNHQLLSSTRGLGLEQARAQIKKLDNEILALQQQQLGNMLNKARPFHGIGSGKRSGWTEGALIRNEINKQRGHISIRSLMERAGLSIQKIKPCFLMSPLTVAQYLDPKKITFDLVIIDEASQMRPENALGGVARAKQIVVVGDQQQLPPTSFFQSVGTDSDEDEEDFTSEAIMDMALSSFRPSRILNRHYRSKHESLIAFSNYHFYDNSLVLFPSPVKNPDELGIRLQYIGGCYVAKSNMDEVQAIVKAALNFMQKYPNRSLGIATMNQVQKDLIELEMDRAFIEHLHAYEYREKWKSTLESFFVKNLENVQGDERDAIFISTVYGPDKNGAVMQRFGPINGINGHRRLNVLFTRAKKNMVVFTSLKPEDIKISDNSSRGVKVLKNFLIYTYTRAIDMAEANNQDPDSDFEIFVKEKLESIGCEVHTQVGVAGYRIDLGVKHQKYPYGYLLGIECDGATYHSSKSARERDVIRQEVLEGLGWRIYRIWSTDWFYNSAKEFEKLKAYIEKLLNLQKENLEQRLCNTIFHY
jgi:very-short-patch-repair endonuclease/DNA polymerase III delta prime subunit